MSLLMYSGNLRNAGNITPPVFPENGVRVYLLTGQSNAEGKASNTNATSLELSEHTNFNIWNGNSFVNLNIGAGNNLSDSGQHGIELGLASNFSTYNPNEIGYMIKYGLGSTTILENSPGGEVYENFYLKFKNGINNLINSGKIPYVYFIYSQGERDANPLTDVNGDTPAAFEQRFLDLIQIWRDNTGNNLPFVAYETLNRYSGSLEVNQYLKSPELTDSKYKMLPMVNEPDIGDGLHFDYIAHKHASVYALDFFANHLGQPITHLII